MKKYIFIQHVGGATIHFLTHSFEHAYLLLIQLVKHPTDWRIKEIAEQIVEI